MFKYNRNTYVNPDITDLVLDCQDGSLQKWADGLYTFCDCQNVILVDTNKGIISKIDPVSFNTVFTFKTGDNSIKKDGYLYCVLNYLGIDNMIHDKKVSQHRVIGFITSRAEVDSLLALGYKTGGVINHIDGCPWNNRADNLECITPKLNTLHGKIFNSLERCYPNMYTYKVHNKSDVDFVVLRSKYIIRGTYINKYISIGGDLHCDNEGSLNIEQINQFIDFMYNYGYWR